MSVVTVSVPGMDWKTWHDGYDQPGSTLTRRLAVVREQIRLVLDAAPPGRVTVLSLCAGEGRDLLDVLADHPRREDVTAWLVELDSEVADAARRRAAGLTGVTVITGDAADSALWTDILPVDLLLLCGIFGNVSDADIAHTVSWTPALCKTGGTVIWTRHRRSPDLVPQLCDWFADAGFAPVFVSDPALPYGVGVHRYEGPPRPLAPGVRLFSFLPEKQ